MLLLTIAAAALAQFEIPDFTHHPDPHELAGEALRLTHTANWQEQLAALLGQYIAQHYDEQVNVKTTNLPTGVMGLGIVLEVSHKLNDKVLLVLFTPDARPFRPTHMRRV